MRHFLFKVFLIALPFVALVSAFELKYRGLPNSRYAVKMHLFEKAKSQIDVIILGSSHGLHAFLPEYISESAFNLANPGQSIYYDTKIVEKYLEGMPMLKVVVLPVSYQSLWYMLDSTQENWRCYYYRYYFGLPHRERRMSYDVRNFSLYFLYGRRGGMFLKNREFDEDVSYWFTKNGGFSLADVARHPALQRVSDTLEISAISRTPKDSSLQNMQNFAENSASIQSLIATLQSKGVKLVLVTVPGSAPYVKRMNPERLAQMRSELESLSNHAGVVRCDYLTDPRFSDEDFLDADHLAPSGAKKFSTIFAAEILSILLPSSPTGG